MPKDSTILLTIYISTRHNLDKLTLFLKHKLKSLKTLSRIITTIQIKTRNENKVLQIKDLHNPSENGKPVELNQLPPAMNLPAV